MFCQTASWRKFSGDNLLYMSVGMKNKRPRKPFRTRRPWQETRVAALVAFGIMYCASAAAARLEVQVADARGNPVPDVVVIAEPLAAASHARTPSSAPTAIMDQINKLFVPEILVVRAGTQVIFPNTDSVEHQVYSFSPAKRFSLGLYRGQPHEPVLFDIPGLVVLGCNIHDNMIGFIYVTESPYFGKSTAAGRVVLADVSAGAYRVVAWSPRFNEPQQQLQQRTAVEEHDDQAVKFIVSHALRPARSESSSAPHVRDY
jgi:plastocyanin